MFDNCDLPKSISQFRNRAVSVNVDLKCPRESDGLLDVVESSASLTSAAQGSGRGMYPRDLQTIRKMIQHTVNLSPVDPRGCVRRAPEPFATRWDVVRHLASRY